MEDHKHPAGNGVLINTKARKKKSSLQDPEMFQPSVDSMKRGHETRTLSGQRGQKAAKRGAVTNASPVFVDRSIPDSQPDSSSSGHEYRALRRKYLLLEEKSFGLGRELKAVEDDIKTLEEEKLSLLDELVVLEGLVDPSELQPQGQRLQ